MPGISMVETGAGSFWGEATVGREQTPVAEGDGILRHHPLMAGATTAVVTLTLGIALFAGPLYRFCERAAADVTDVTAYVSAVLG